MMRGGPPSRYGGGHRQSLIQKDDETLDDNSNSQKYIDIPGKNEWRSVIDPDVANGVGVLSYPRTKVAPASNYENYTGNMYELAEMYGNALAPERVHVIDPIAY